MCFGNQHTFTLGSSTTGGDMPTSLRCACGSTSRADIAPLAQLQAEVAKLRHAASVAAGALLLIRSADSLREKDRIAFDALNAFMNLSGFERGSVTPDDARAALAMRGEAAG